MSAAQSSSQGSTWTEPPWSGWIETTGDALLILEAARRGLIPRVTRRLVDSERKMITSGSVFVFDEDESGIKRWTDGFFWSPSRILGNFLLYRETDKRGAGHRGARSEANSSDTNDLNQFNPDSAKVDAHSLSRPRSDSSYTGVDKSRERTLVGSLTNSYRFKPDGLMKKTFSLTIAGVSQHLISYYKVEDVENGRLRSPSSLPELASLDISPEYLDKTHFRNPPKVEIGTDGLPRYRGEADDIDTSPSLLTAPLSTSLPLLTDGHVHEDANSSRRGKNRYGPYNNNPPSTAKRPRKQTKSSPIEPSTSSPDQLTSQSITTAVTYPDPNFPAAPPVHYTHPYGVTPYYPVMGYPAHSGYPAPSPSYAPNSVLPQHPGPHPQAANPQPTQYHYTGYPPVAGNVEAAQSPQVAQQPYYSYPPPAPGYPPGFSAVTWPQYSAYSQQPVPPQAQSAVLTEDDKTENAIETTRE